MSTMINKKEEDQANLLVKNGDSEQTITLTQFVDAVTKDGGTYDGQGVVVEIAPASGCRQNHPDHPAFVDGCTPERIQFYSGTAYAQYQRFAGKQDIAISNVTFRLVPPEDKILVCGAWNTTQASAEPDKLDAELQLNNTGSVSFTDCVFENVAVSPIGSKSSVSFADCDFSGLAQYAIKDVNASKVSITDSTFDDCSGGVYMSGGGTTSATYTDNTFTDIGERGAIQFSTSGDYSQAAISITGNSFTGKDGEEAGFLRQLNFTITQETISQIMESNNIPADMFFTADSNDANDQLPAGCNFTSNNTVFDGQSYYQTMKAALEGIHLNGKSTLWCKPGADLGTLTHGHVCADLTIYGNGAYISGGERDFELDTYQYCHNATNSCNGLTKDTALTVYNLNGAAVWGQRTTACTVSIYLEGCQNMQRVYLSGTSGTNNITLKDCTFDATQKDAGKKASTCTLYSNAVGTILVDGCTFTGVQEPINLNNKAVSGTQKITVQDSTFKNCSTTDICISDVTWAAPIRIVSSEGADSKLTVRDCDFQYSSEKVSCNGDILLGDGRSDKESYPVYAEISGTSAEVQIQTPGDRTEGANHAQKVSVSASEQVELTNVVASIDGTEYASLAEAIQAAGSMSGNVTITLLNDVDISGMLKDNQTMDAFDLSASTSLTGLTIRGANQSVQIISGVDGNNIDGANYCPVLTVKLPAGASLMVENLTVPNDLLFDTTKGGTLVVQDCVFYGAQSGYPQAGSITYQDNLFEFKGTAENFHTCNAYPVWYKSDGALDFVFYNNTVIGYRGVHIETRSNNEVNIQVDHNHFVLKDEDHENKTIALQLVRYINGNVSFSDNYVDAYMAVCFFKDIQWVDGSLTIQNNQLSSGCKLYGSNEWDPDSGESGADAFAQSFINSIPAGDRTIHTGHTEHDYVNGVCTICGRREPSSGGGGSSTSGYLVSVDSGKNGKVTVSPQRAEQGETVTITVKPDEGYELDELTVTDKNGDSVKVSYKDDNKYTFKMPGSAVTVEATFQAVKEESPVDAFLDINTGAWYYDAVKYAVENGLMSGTGTYTFEPNTTLSRGMIAQMLYALEGKPSVSATNSFTDVSANDWYAKAASWTQSKGIITGYDDGRFAPNDPLTREQLALILYNYAQSKGYDTSAKADLSKYVDGSSTSAWAQTAMTWAVGEGLLSGRGLNMLYPTGTATRAEVAQIMMNFCENTAK